MAEPDAAASRLTSPAAPAISRWYPAGFAALAIFIRFAVVMNAGGLRTVGRYDDGVYYSAADALVHGRVPYRDFVLLHPPGLMCILTPFALLGRLTDDWIGFAVARVAFIGVGGLNAALVTLVAARWGRSAAIASGVLYACWFPAVYSEQTTLLEPLGGTALLVALWLLTKPARKQSRRSLVLIGVALGCGALIKIWYVGVWLAVAGWQLVATRRRTSLLIVYSGALTIAAGCLPFLILAHGRMFDMVVRDQFGRSTATTGRLARVSSIEGLDQLVGGHSLAFNVFVAIIAVAIVGAAVSCWLDPTARLIVVVLVVNTVILFVTPTYYSHYAALDAQPITLALGIGLSRLRFAAATAPRRVAFITASTVVALVSSTAILAEHDVTPNHPLPTAELAAALPPGCIAADDPSALIETDRLSSDLAAGCLVPVDETGIGYDDEAHPVNSRVDNPVFQGWIIDYLTSANAFILIRPYTLGLTPESAHDLARYPKLYVGTAVDGKAHYLVREGDGELNPAVAAAEVPTV